MPAISYSPKLPITRQCPYLGRSLTCSLMTPNTHAVYMLWSDLYFASMALVDDSDRVEIDGVRRPREGKTS